MQPTITLLAALLLAPLTALHAAAAPEQRSNILFLFADDWGWPHASCLGDPVVKTPTFDRMAREGLLFRNARSASPRSSPARRSNGIRSPKKSPPTPRLPPI